MNKPKIVIIVDKPQWAYHNIANELVKRLKSTYSFEIKYCPEIDYVNKNHKRWDLIFAMGWKWNSPRDIKTPREKTIAVVHSFRTLIGACTKYWADYLNDRYCGVGFVNDQLYSRFENLIEHRFLTQNGVDTLKFLPRERNSDESIVVGWAGCGCLTFRGVHFVREAIDKCLGVSLRIQNADGARIPFAKMPDFYRSLDCYVNASESEGCSLTILEAGACSLPIIATDTGTVASLIVDGETGYMIHRTVNSISNALSKLNKQNCITMGGKMRKRIIETGWTWEDKILGYSELIKHGVNYE